MLSIDGDRNILTLVDYAFSDEPMDVITRRTPEGFGFMGALPGLAAGRHIPCLVTSAMDAGEVEDRAMALGASKFIPKPSFPDEVRKV